MMPSFRCILVCSIPLLATAKVLLPAAGATTVQLFEWSWEDVAKECEDWLGPKGFTSALVSPPSEHIVGEQWWTRYQVVTYNLTSRSGDEKAFASMVQRCRQAGVGIIVDAVFNQMAADKGVGVAGSTFGGSDKTKMRTYPTYDQTHFHHQAMLPQLESGDRIYLKAFHGKRIDVDGTTLKARFTDQGIWQTMSIYKAGGGRIHSGDTVLLKSQHTGHYIGMAHNSIHANSRDPAQAQYRLVIKKRGWGPIESESTVILRGFSGNYLEVTGDNFTEVGVGRNDGGHFNKAEKKKGKPKKKAAKPEQETKKDAVAEEVEEEEEDAVVKEDEEEEDAEEPQEEKHSNDELDYVLDNQKMVIEKYGYLSSNCIIEDYTNREDVQYCDLLGMPDLCTACEHVQATVAAYLNHLAELGVAGLRIDAAKHQAADELSALLDRVDRSMTRFVEVIGDEDEPVKPAEYTSFAQVTEFEYSKALAYYFDELSTASLEELLFLGEPRSFVPSSHAVVFVDNHDTQRGEIGEMSALSHREPLYALATIFMLAYPYGYPIVMSSYWFTSSQEGPPEEPVHEDGHVRCGDEEPWVCEHRWAPIANMIAWRKSAGDSNISFVVAPTNDTLAFCRGKHACVALNRGGPFAWELDLSVELPPGLYCNVIQSVEAGECSFVKIDINGKTRIRVPPWGAIAFHVGALRAASDILPQVVRSSRSERFEPAPLGVQHRPKEEVQAAAEPNKRRPPSRFRRQSAAAVKESAQPDPVVATEAPGTQRQTNGPERQVEPAAESHRDDEHLERQAGQQQRPEGSAISLRTIAATLLLSLVAVVALLLARHRARKAQGPQQEQQVEMQSRWSSRFTGGASSSGAPGQAHGFWGLRACFT